MAEKLSITIGLEGGKEIERQLADIGYAGQKAFLDIATAAEQAGGFKNIKPEQVTAKLREMGIVGEDAFNKISGALAAATRTERLVGAVQAAESGFAGLASAAAAFGRALVPIGSAAGIALGAVVKVAADAASAIHKADTEAIKLGLSISKFDQLKQGFEKAGASAGAIAEGLTHAKEAIDKFNLDRVALLFEVAAEKAKKAGGRMESDFTRSVNILKRMAGEVGPAADAARAALVKLGEAPGAAGAKLPALEELFRRLGITVTDAGTTIPQFVEKMRQLPDSAQRTADAIAFLGPKLGVEFIQALRTGGVAVDLFVQKMAGLTQAEADAANKMEQDWNWVWSSWDRLKTALGATLLVNVPENLQSTLDAINALLQADNWAKWGRKPRPRSRTWLQRSTLWR